MKSPSPILPALLLAIAVVGGCARGSVDPAQYQAASCPELDDAIGANSKDITATAVRRGKVANWKPPFWVPGVERGVDAIKGRQTTKIERLQGQGNALIAERARRC